MHTIHLKRTWAVRPAGLMCAGPAGYRRIRQKRDGWIPATVPGEIHLDLMKAGLMPEPLVSNHAPECRWPEKKSWWYRTSFKVPAAFLKYERQQMIFDGLDLYAQVFVNGMLIGTARNAFVPAVFDASRALKSGRNELMVRLTAGMELAADKFVPHRPPHLYDPLYNNRNNWNIIWLRKPQFTYGWDWVDALPNIGIWRGVRLEGRRHVAIHDLRMDTLRQGNRVVVRAEAILDNLSAWSERNCALEIRIQPPRGRPISRRLDLDVSVGHGPITCMIEIPNPQLWWPNGMGAQPLYQVTARVLNGRNECDRREFYIGLRTIEIDRSRLRQGSRFCVRVNGQEVFCKGANWIPADAILARMDRKKYETLIAEAKNANINMLRIWGGGIYEDPAFYDACDRAGILLWHDFMFACMLYPDYDADFRAAVRAEAEAVVSALRHHPSIALWCGNNENTWGFCNWWRNKYGRHNTDGKIIYNTILPDVCRMFDPQRFYWPGSPCGGSEPNDEQAGDCHWWGPCTMNPDVNRRIRHEVFDECQARFVSEYGVIGPLHFDSYKQFLKPAERQPNTRAWQIHTNSYEKKTLPEAIRRHYAEPEGLTIADYILFGQMFQAVMYGRSLEALRFRKNDPHDDCQGALIWMYSDCWGETGWTIIDYYLRRKAGYYWFRRACTPVKAIVRRRGRHLVTRVINDTLKTQHVTLHYGWMRCDGKDRRMETRALALHPNSMREIVREPIPADRRLHPHEYFYTAYLTGPGIDDAPSLWLFKPHREMALIAPDISITMKGKCITLVSPAYCHGVHAEDHGRAVFSDNYFDLLPGVPKQIKRLDKKTGIPRFTAVRP